MFNEVFTMKSAKEEIIKDVVTFLRDEMNNENYNSLENFSKKIYKTYTEMRNMAEWKKVESKIFVFEKAGDVLEGKLIAVEDGQLYGNKIYSVETASDGVQKAFSTAVMESQMASVKVGDMIRIEFAGVKPNKNKKLNDIKLFNVYTK